MIFAFYNPLNDMHHKTFVTYVSITNYMRVTYMYTLQIHFAKLCNVTHYQLMRD